MADFIRIESWRSGNAYPGAPLHRCQRLLQVGPQIIDMLDADGQAHHVGTDACLGQFGRVELAVGGAGRMAGRRLGVTNVGGGAG
jgi:hypothetical protein